MAGAVLPIFVGEALWPDFQVICDGGPRVVHFYFAGYGKSGLKRLLQRDVDAVLTEPTRKKIAARASEAVDAAAEAAATTALAVGEASSEAAAPRPAHAEAYDAFVALVVDLFSEICRDTHELRHICRQLFPAYVQPVADGDVELSNKAELRKAIFPAFREAIRKVYSRNGLQLDDESMAVAGSGLQLQLPTCAQWLLLAGFLASRLPPRADVALFSHAARRPGRRGPRKAKLSDTAHPFTLDRLLAIYTSIALEEPAGGPAAAALAAASAVKGVKPTNATAQLPTARPPVRAELLIQAAGLVDLRLFSRAAVRDGQIDCPRLRCEVSKKVVRTVADKLKFDLTQYEEE